MKMIEAAYYNENDTYCYYWLLNLIKKKLIMQGDVDGRSIEDVRPEEVKVYRQCHFFAGIGVWSYALKQAKYRLATKNERVWTGSCPCQPFSTAGSRRGFADERHLWPSWFHLIQHCRPELLFGEQVASGAAYRWLDLVQTDLEGANYAAGAVDLAAGGFGSPHMRNRLYWLAYSKSLGKIRDAGHTALLRSSKSSPKSSDRPVSRYNGSNAVQRGSTPYAAEEWKKNFDELQDSYGRKWPIERGAFPLVDGSAANVDAVRAYGNAIVAPVAVEFIKAALACRP